MIMLNWKRQLVGVLVFSVSMLPAYDSEIWAASLTAAPIERTRGAVTLLGEGAKIKVKLTDGEKLKGAIHGLGEEGFLLNVEGQGDPKKITYNEVAELKPAKRSYKASGQPDPIQARGSVVGLGVGKHIKVKFDGDRVLHGNITAIGENQFTMLPDQQQQPIEIAYNNVNLVHKNLSTGSTVVLLLVVAGAIAIAAVALTGSDTVRGSF